MPINYCTSFKIQHYHMMPNYVNKLLIDIYTKLLSALHVQRFINLYFHLLLFTTRLLVEKTLTLQN